MALLPTFSLCPPGAACGGGSPPLRAGTDVLPRGKMPGRPMMAAVARDRTRGRAPDGAWAAADPASGPDTRRNFAASCAADASRTACAAPSDHGGCADKVRQGRTPSETNLPAGHGHPGAGGAFPLARSPARKARNGDATGLTGIADPNGFPAPRSGMGG